MSFLSPLALLLAATALVPLLLHLRRGRVTRVVEFPGARYLARATEENQRALRVRSSVLLLIQLAIVALVALAAARPLARLGTGHAPAALAVVLDNSMSTGVVSGGKPLLDSLKDVARIVVARSTPQDRVWLVTADGAATEADATALLAVLDTLRPLPSASSPSAAAATAWTIAARAPGATPTIAVITDGQRSTWRDRVSAGQAVSVFAPLGGAPANRGVVVAEPTPARWASRGAVRFGASSADSVPFRIVLDERTVARGIAPPGATAEVSVAVAGSGWATGRVELPRDELAADDARWFAVWQGATPGVDARAGSFAQSAVDALVGAGTLRAGRDVWIVTADDVTNQPSLVVAPLRPGRVGAANLALARAGIPWRLGAERRAESVARGPGLSASVRLRYALAPTSAAPTDTLATVGGEPWIVGGEGYVLIASPIDTSATSLPVTAEFVPWMARAITDRLAPGGGPITAATPGARVAVPRDADGLDAGGPSRLPAHDSIVLPVRAGVYFWTRDTKRVGAVVVNAEPAESDLRRLNDGELAARFAPAPARVTHDAGAFAGAVFGAASRRPVAAPLLVGALGLLLVETLLAGARPRRTDAGHQRDREAA